MNKLFARELARQSLGQSNLKDADGIKSALAAQFEEFASWYNRRIRGALWLEIGEAPEQTFQRKLPPEVTLGLFCRLCGW